MNHYHLSGQVKTKTVKLKFKRSVLPHHPSLTEHLPCVFICTTSENVTNDIMLSTEI